MDIVDTAIACTYPRSQHAINARPARSCFSLPANTVSMHARCADDFLLQHSLRPFFESIASRECYRFNWYARAVPPPSTLIRRRLHRQAAENVRRFSSALLAGLFHHRPTCDSTSYLTTVGSLTINFADMQPSSVCDFVFNNPCAQMPTSCACSYSNMYASSWYLLGYPPNHSPSQRSLTAENDLCSTLLHLLRLHTDRTPSNPISQ